MVSRRPLTSFVVLAFALSWGYWGVLVARGWVSHPGQGWPTHLPGLLGPAIAAVVVTAVADGRPGLRDLASRTLRWRLPWRWWALGVATALIPVLVWSWQALTGGGWPSARELTAYSGAPVVALPLLVLGVLVVNGFGEEVGWRGMLAHRLLDRHSLLTTSVVVWVVWAAWHLPVFLVVADFREMGWTALGWLVGLAAASVVLTWMYDGTGRSILFVAVWHTVFNFTSATEATNGLPAAISSTLVMALAVGVVVHERREVRDAGSRTPRASPSTGSS